MFTDMVGVRVSALGRGVTQVVGTLGEVLRTDPPKPDFAGVQAVIISTTVLKRMNDNTVTTDNVEPPLIT